MIKFILYTSEISDNLSNKELTNLIADARYNNKRDLITGVLLYLDGIFIQYIEGPEKNVDELYKKIIKDSRHKIFKILKSGTLDSRKYEQWHMLFKKMSSVEIDQLLKNTTIDLKGEDLVSLNYNQTIQILNMLQL